jgi:predicted AlkP superfamily pyrophosphatase or phosphodiesterase
VPKKLVVIVIDGLTAPTFEAAADSPETPALAALAAAGSYRRAVSTFPSLTPVCLSSIATGAHPDVHGIPHLVWYHREEARLVEYGSSFGALRAAGLARSLRDTVIDMTQRHLAEGAVTLFESVEDAGLTPATVNFTCYRGRTLHRASVPGVPPVKGPRRFYFFNLFESDSTGARFSVRNRAAGTVDGYATAVGRWLVTRDGFDLLVFYLSDYDYASHLYGPDEAREALVRSDRAVGALLEAAGGVDEFLERYAVVLCSDHGQTAVGQAARLEQPFADDDGVLVTASNRAGMVYRLPACTAYARTLALRLDGEPSVDVTLFREGDTAVAWREGEELRFAPANDGWRTEGD